jgi:Bacterial Ig domain
MYRSAALRLAIGLAVFLHVFPLSAASVWFGDKDGLHRIDTATNQIAASIPFEPAHAIAVNAGDGSLWAISQQRIARLGEQGSVLFQVAIRDLGTGLGAPQQLALNPNDGSIWAGFENGVLHLDSAGVVRHELSVRARDLAVAQDGSLWILTQSSLQQHDAAGTLTRSIALPNAQRFQHLALDDAGGAVWVAGEKDLVQVSLANPEQTLLSLLAPETVSGISVDLQSGDLWAIGQNGLFAYGRNGMPRVSRDLRDFSIANAQTLLFDFSSQAAWVGHQHGLTRITVAGTVAATFPAATHVATIAIGRTPVSIDPVVSIVAPADGALLRNATPELRVDYDALCGTTPCGFPNSFFSTFTLFAKINGTETGSSFVFDPATGGASFTPSAPLPEGVNTFSAQARDSFGRLSPTVSSSFTIDTIAPSFGPITPASGAVVSTSTITIAGSVDDANATVTLGDQTQGPNFNFVVTLVEGANTFTLVVRDAAGNTTSSPLTYTYEKPNVPPSVAITSPASGANFTAPATFTVLANATDSDGTIVRVDFYNNGVLAGSADAAPFAVTVANLVTGSYTLTAQATDNRGGVTMSAPVSVSVGPPNALPSVQLTSPAANATYLEPASVSVSATAADSDGTIAKVEFLRNGVVEATDTSAPFTATLTNVPAGTHSLTARATDDRGGVTTSAAVSIVVRAISVTIDTPFSGAGINSNYTLVRGRIVAPPYSGVKIGEHTAAVDAAGNFALLHPLEPGTNLLTATLTTLDGRTATHTIFVNASGSLSPFSVDVQPSAGYAPLAAALTVYNPNNVNASFTFDGSGPFFLPARGSTQLNLTVPVGVHTPAIIIRVGTQSFVHRLVIESRDRAQTDAMLRTVWSGMNAALVAGNKDTALSYLTENSKEKYGPVFDALLAHMPAIVASYSTLEQLSLTDTIGEYAVTRTDGATKRLYLIYFVRDASGLWRIDGM